MRNPNKLSREEKIKYALEHPELDYSQLAKELGYKNADSVRSFCQRQGIPNQRINLQSKRHDIDLPSMVFQSIKTRKRTIIELADMFGVPPKDITAALAIIKKRHVLVDEIDDGVQLARDMKQPEAPYRIDIGKHGTTEIPFGFATDTHLNSKYERLDVLHSLYDRFAEAGVKTVFHGGNWIDGDHPRINKYEIHTYGVEGQLNYFIENYPQRDGITTRFISGDDHEGWFVQQNHIDIGQTMVDRAMKAGRTDLVDLGYMERDIALVQPDGEAILRVIHAGGGSTYAHSYTAQKYVEMLQGGEKPKIVLVGHYHKYNHSYPREVHVIQGGCVEDQTPFMRKRKLQAMVGGVILWLTQAGNGVITSVKVEWMPYYDKKFYAYQW